MMKEKIKTKIVFLVIFILLSLTCKKSDRSSGESNLVGGGGGGGGEKPPPSDDDDDVSLTISVGQVAKTSMYTKSATESECLDISFRVEEAEVPKDKAEVAFSLGFQKDVGSGTGKESELTDKEKGSLDKDKGTTNTNGQIQVSYCSGTAEGKVTIRATVGEVSANSPEITITQKPTISFEFAGYFVDSELKTISSSESVIYLNLFDSGPKDCTVLEFKVSNSGTPLDDVQAKFKTQIDFPRGVKLAAKADTGTTATDETTEKKYAYIDVTSKSGGLFIVPVCAGVELGTIVVYGELNVEDLVPGRTFKAQSPVLRITSGVVNYTNMSLTFDNANAKILQAYFNQNSDDIHPFWVQLGSRKDGQPISDYPVSVVAETGKIVVENGGIPDSSTGMVKFTMQALHAGMYRPYAINKYTNPEAQTHCSPQALAEETNGVLYTDLAKNWRSTLVYMIRGQEYFYDANGNGIYDAGGHGFWDKNQDGVYDDGDELTYDPDNDGNFSSDGDWFIDLPTPFIDVNEDGKYDADIDILVGDEYQAPNGVRDDDTIIWKYEYIPITFGTSHYSLISAKVKNEDDGGVGDYTDTIGKSYYTDLRDRGLRGYDTNIDVEVYRLNDIDKKALWHKDDPTDLEMSDTGTAYRYFFAHDICGNPLPGGTEAVVTYAAAQAATYGPRGVGAHFNIQPEDIIKEPSRQLLKEAEGKSTGIINFNITDHPASQYSYPIQFSFSVDPCQNNCTGVVKTAGVACDEAVANIKLTVGTDGLTSKAAYPAVKTCTCGANTEFEKGVCNCKNSFKVTDDGTDCEAE